MFPIPLPLLLNYMKHKYKVNTITCRCMVSIVELQCNCWICLSSLTLNKLWFHTDCGTVRHSCSMTAGTWMQVWRGSSDQMFIWALLAFEGKSGCLWEGTCASFVLRWEKVERKHFWCLLQCVSWSEVLTAVCLLEWDAYCSVPLGVRCLLQCVSW